MNIEQSHSNGISTQKIAIIIPCYNEGKTILQVLDRISKVMTKNKFNYRIIVIDDGSTDNSYETLSKLNDPSLYILKNKRNLGKGATLINGFKQIRKEEIVITIDGDGEHYPEDIPLLLEPILKKQAHVTIGSRFLKIKDSKYGFKGSYLNNLKKYSHIRKFGNWLFSVLILIFHHKFITDSQCGYRAFTKNIIPKIKFQSKGFQIETELTIKTLQLGYKIKEVPIHNGISPRASHMKMVFDSIKIILTIVDMSIKNKKIRKTLRSLLRAFI